MIDELIEMQSLAKEGSIFNFSSLLTGSEGTLAIATAIKVKQSLLPPSQKALLSVQTNSIEEALQGNILALQHQPASIELMDKLILDLSKQNATQNKNRFFVKGDPVAILIIEVIEDSEDKVAAKIQQIIQSLEKTGIGNHYQTITGNKMNQVWALRKAGLGVMSNAKGDRKPVTVVEDVAILPEKYPDYYREFKKLLKEFGLQCAFYAHISMGELHNKPVFNLKDKEEIKKFREFAYRNALLVKKFGGSLNGEHGDGRLRGEFYLS